MSPEAVNMLWLLRVRRDVWIAQGLLLAIAAWGLNVRLEGWLLTGLVLFAMTTNVGLYVWNRRGGLATQNAILWTMLLDITLHTAVFMLSGGQHNPFTQLYLVDIALGTLILTRLRQWHVLIATALGFATLFFSDAILPASLTVPNHAELMRVHLEGMLVAFAVTSAFIVNFMHRVLRSLKERDAELAMARAAAAKNEKLAALTTLSAGAAHELATPLGTIAVASKELARALETRDVPQAWRDDAVLVREQVQRCREILQQMSASSGELAAEGLTRFTLQELVANTLAHVKGSEQVARPTVDVELSGPRVALGQALASLVRNALQAARTKVELRARVEGPKLALEVRDDGAGLPPELLSRIGEPFFTTRPAGQGMGLGVFLARTLATQLGGALDYECPPEGGTVARLTLPLAGESP